MGNIFKNYVKKLFSKKKLVNKQIKEDNDNINKNKQIKRESKYTQTNKNNNNLVYKQQMINKITNNNYKQYSTSSTEDNNTAIVIHCDIPTHVDSVDNKAINRIHKFRRNSKNKN